MAQKFRKKPVVIEAVQWDGTEQAAVQITAFVGIHIMGNGPNFNIQTLEGSMMVSPGDWIIRGVKGEFYPCRDDIFQLTYELA